MLTSTHPSELACEVNLLVLILPTEKWALRPVRSVSLVTPSRWHQKAEGSAQLWLSDVVSVAASSHPRGFAAEQTAGLSHLLRSAVEDGQRGPARGQGFPGPCLQPHGQWCRSYVLCSYICERASLLNQHLPSRCVDCWEPLLADLGQGQLSAWKVPAH